MKRIALSFLSVATLLSFTACDSSSKLAEQLEGTWSGSPQNITDNSALSASILETYEFNKLPDVDNNGKPGGVITIVGMISATTQMVEENAGENPFEFSASARSTISGTWISVDDDEVILRLDPATLEVNVDPDAVIPGSALLPDHQKARIEELKPGVMQMISSSLKNVLLQRYASLNKLDDVKVKDSMLKFEIGDTDHVFILQGAPK